MYIHINAIAAFDDNEAFKPINSRSSLFVTLMQSDNSERFINK
jgi:hypothetical protein